jgi:hypothetical protein
VGATIPGVTPDGARAFMHALAQTALRRGLHVERFAVGLRAAGVARRAGDAAGAGDGVAAMLVELLWCPPPARPAADEPRLPRPARMHAPHGAPLLSPLLARPGSAGRARRVLWAQTEGADGERGRLVELCQDLYLKQALVRRAQAGCRRPDVCCAGAGRRLRQTLAWPRRGRKGAGVRRAACCRRPDVCCADAERRLRRLLTCGPGRTACCRRLAVCCALQGAA